MKKLAPCLLAAAVLCLSSCSRNTASLNDTIGPSAAAYLKTLNKEAREENAPYRHRISADGRAFEKYPAANFEKVRDEIDLAPARPTETCAFMQWDILGKIAVCEQEYGGDINPVIVEIRPLKGTKDLYREAWIIDRKGEIVEYLVTVKLLEDDIQYKMYPM